MIKEAKLKKATQFPKKWFGLEPKLYREVSLFYGTLFNQGNNIRIFRAFALPN